MCGTTALPYGWVSCPVFSGATLFGGFGSGLLLLICSMDFFCPPRNPPFAMSEPTESKPGVYCHAWHNSTAVGLGALSRVLRGNSVRRLWEWATSSPYAQWISSAHPAILHLPWANLHWP